MIILGMKFGVHKSADVMMNFLRDKYLEEFEIHEISYHNSSYSTHQYYYGKAYSVNDPNLLFSFKLSNRHKVIGDDYMNVVMAEKVKKAVTPIIKEMFHEEMIMNLRIYHGIDKFPDHRYINKNMTFHDYFMQQRKTEIRTYIPIYFSCPSPIVKEEEAKRTNEFVQKLKDLGLHNTEGIIFYLKPNTYQKIKHMSVNEIDKITDMDLYAEEYVYNVCEFEQKGNSKKAKRYYYL
ncbi:hypothetical protein FZW96_13575 [Bacillus sp. BGMRC 2118]|nr:hypothetical protein FZW96_13575 [Bacillus sp. BGMRC 2118]